MARDKNDYENNKVYTWKKPPFSSTRPCRNRGKQVSFSDQEGEVADNTLARTMSDSSFDRSLTSPEPARSNNNRTPGNPHRSGQTKKKKPFTKRQEEGAGDTNTTSNARYGTSRRDK